MLSCEGEGLGGARTNSNPGGPTWLWGCIPLTLQSGLFRAKRVLGTARQGLILDRAPCLAVCALRHVGRTQV